MPTINHKLDKIDLKINELTEKKNNFNNRNIKIYNSNQNLKYLEISLATYDLAIETINRIRSGYLSEESKLFLAENEFETFSNALETSYKLYALSNDDKYLEIIKEFADKHNIK